MELDDLDKRILQQLQKDSNLTNQALSEIVHVSAPTCLRRVRQLHQRGIIQKTVAIVDPTRVATTLTAIVEVTLDVQTAEAYREFEESVAGEQSILQAYRVSSGPDFVLIVQVQDMPAYHAFLPRKKMYGTCAVFSRFTAASSKPSSL